MNPLQGLSWGGCWHMQCFQLGWHFTILWRKKCLFSHGFHRCLLNTFNRLTTVLIRTRLASFKLKYLKNLNVVESIKQSESCSHILMHSLYFRYLKNHTGTRRARPRSVFNVRLFNGNLESFIKVLTNSLPAWHLLLCIFYLASAFWWVPPKHLSWFLFKKEVC